MPYSKITSNLSQPVIPSSQMRIQPTNSNAVSTGNASENTATVAVDHTSLSSTASLISQGLGSSSDSDVRTDKIAALQQSIAAGTYNVSASAVADKLMSSMLG
jgi:negative regulator of flagellin synthesis FlgM